MGRSGQTLGRHRRARQLAENYAASIGEAWDEEDEALRVEFHGLDLTDEEMADLNEAFRLRRSGATASERIASRQLFADVRKSLANALAATLEHENRRDHVIRALAVFDRDEAAAVQRIEVALCRPCTDGDIARLKGDLNWFETTRVHRRKIAIAEIADPGEVSVMPRSDARRIHSRDGLASLYDAGKLTLRQLMAGRAYRRRWEAAFRGLRSALGGDGGSSPPGRIVAAQERSAQWELERSRCDTAVQLRLREHPQALMLLRRVAGEGASLTAVVGNGKRHGLALAVLIKTLTLVDLMLPYEDG